MGLTPKTRAYLDKFEIEQPSDVMKGHFAWSDFLQAFLQNPGVNVSAFHPIFGLRKAYQYADLCLAGLASPDGPNSQTYILSGVREKGAPDNLKPGSQWWFWVRDLKRLGLRPTQPYGTQEGSGGVANPERERGRDGEGIMRRSSNHVAQQMPGPWGALVGYASDDRTQRGGTDEAWRPVHERMAAAGLDWPLKPGVAPIVERWHMQAQGLNMRWYPGPFPEVPGVHRPLVPGFYSTAGAEVGVFQAQAAHMLQLQVLRPDHKGVAPGGTVKRDGHYGPMSAGLAKKMQQLLQRPATGVWMRADQVAYIKWNQRQRPPVVTPKPAPPKPDPKPAGSSSIVTLKTIRALVDDLIKAEETNQ